MLQNKKILIFVSGSIAIYKTLSLIRSLRKEGALVRVIATQSALKFITPLSFETLSNTPLLHDGNECWASMPYRDSTNKHTLDTQIQVDLGDPPRNHIGYAKWADIALFAPLTANSLNKLANGIADNIYLSSALALPNIPKLLAPSANTLMLENPITQENIQILKDNGYTFIESTCGMLACGDVGNGAMADIETILFAIRQACFHNLYWKDRYVIVTGGGSIEDIDSVRCVSNHSSGIQAGNLALALYYLGAKVTLISSKFPMNLPLNIKQIQVKSSNDYENAIHHTIKSIHASDKIYLFMTAAISDYIPHKREGKLKKKDLGNAMTLELYENKDILATLQANNLVKIGFKAECDEINAKVHAKNALIKKQCAMMCLNIISESNMGFGATHNKLYLITKDSEKYIQGTKLEVSLEICLHLQALGL
ncbi:bifunctional phosphopantothenoylcysteine decarboxylase/phosphopantothenate--cysteine ligase CoaBC [Helicobacter trogontum]|uniref:Coenzyme A biosynthesis bifunctional protein CoaBC n=1 Tax=Helicobacter trogontum TaxID=50960 RepID=A0A4U8SEX1_9HELI|nr:bifunctional phosphopantothenoylcysteine decarboxylase/phosphopantothenate--cysteine ligase CoaBC [Helicobacter trogontum]TLD84748.1 bifunctional phosphopantothenoylcysteine decarboxylase/phosphopantothenate--cysteine ligase CoaBC [Helicobacter trogontum]